MKGKMKKEKRSSRSLVDTKIDVRIILASLWISQFLLWTFGDMVSLLQDMSDPIANELLAFVAVPLSLLQVAMILFTLMGKSRYARWVNMGVATIFILFNIGFLAEAKFGWEFMLGAGYIAVNVLIICIALKWPRVSGINKEGCD